MPMTLSWLYAICLKDLHSDRVACPPCKPEVEDGMAKLDPLIPIPSESSNTQYKIVYAVARAR